MTEATPDAVVEGDQLEAASERVDPDRRLPWGFRLAAVVAVAPIFVAALRNGLRGWEPTRDAGTTAVRIRDVFSAHPPLVGMFAFPSGLGGEHFAFPGAIQLYLLAVPVRLFGTTWGLLFGVASLHALGLLVALWLIRRRVGLVGGIVAAAFVASLLVSFGSEVLVDVSPLQAIALPMLLLLVAAWSVADGDAPALVVLAAVANFLFLSHLVLTLVAPVVTGAALLGWGFWLRQSRRDDAVAWQVVRKRHGRWLGAAGVLTLVLWIPSLYDQFAGSGNLGRLVSAMVHGTGTDSAVGGTIHGGFGAVVSVTAVPPFWMPPSFSDPPFDFYGGGQPGALRWLAAVVLVGLFVTALWWTRRVGDRTLGRGLMVAAVGWFAWVGTWIVNPSANAIPIHYFWGLWPLSAFVWFVLVVTGGRMLARRRPQLLRHRRSFAAVGLAAVVVIASVGVPRRNNCGGRCASMNDSLVAASQQMRATAARVGAGHRAVLVGAAPGVPFGFGQALLLGLQDAGVPSRVETPLFVQQFGASRDASVHRDATLRLDVTLSANTSRTGEVVGVYHQTAQVSAARYADLNRRMQRWSASDPHLLAHPEEQLAAAGRRKMYRYVALIWAAQQKNADDLVPFGRFVATLVASGVVPDDEVYDIPGMTRGDVNDWATETFRRSNGTFYLTASPVE